MDIKLAEVSNTSQTTSNYLYYSPSEIQQIYGATPLYKEGYNGAGMTIAIVDAYGDPYIQSELNAFDQVFGLPRTTVNVICVDGPCNYYNGITTGWNGEIALDVEWAHAMAPGAAIYLYVGSTNAQPLYDAVAAAVAGTNGNRTFYPIPSVVSMSWGEPENDFGGSASVAPVYGESYPWMNQVFQHGAAEGITFFASSGDAGAYDQGYPFYQTSPYGGPEYPSTDPFVTSVGGTSLYMSTTSGYLQGGWGATPSPNAIGSYGYETAWSWNNYYGWGTGGGFSTFFNQPYWQTGVGVPNGETRGVPDVSWDADPMTGVLVYVSGGFWVFGGTSVGSPSWAGSMALIDSVAGHSLGFIDPELYSILNNPTEYTEAFHDVMVGGNDPLLAGRGWDPLTGVGTPNIGELASILASPLTSLSVQASNSVARGTSAAYGSTVTINATVMSSTGPVITGTMSAVLTSNTGAAIATIPMAYSSGNWTGTYTIGPSDPPGMWTATVSITSGSESGTDTTTFSVGDGVTIFESWGFFYAGESVPIAAVATAPDGSVDIGASLTATFYLGTPTGVFEGTTALTYHLFCASTAPKGCWQGYFIIPATADQGAWVLSVSGMDSSGNSVAPAYSWLNVGLTAETVTDSPIYMLGDKIFIGSNITYGNVYIATTGSFDATVWNNGVSLGTVPLGYNSTYGLWLGTFVTLSSDPTGFYRIVVNGNDGLGNSAYGETLVRVAPQSLSMTLTLSRPVTLDTIPTEAVFAGITYPNGTSMTVGSADAFLSTASGNFYAPLTYNTASKEFVGTLPVQAMNLSPGSYQVYIFAFDPLGNEGETLGSFSVQTSTVTHLNCNSPIIVGQSSTCTAKVTGYQTYYPSGTVSFIASGSGAFNSTSCTLWMTGLCAVTFTPSTSVGSPQTITASYSGDAYDLSSSGTYRITVNRETSGTVVTCAASSVILGNYTECTTKVTGTSPTGSVYWSQSGVGFVDLSSSSCTLASGQCNVTATGELVGSLQLKAAYGGNTYNAPSSGTLALTVVNMKVSVSCTPVSVVVGTRTTCIATSTSIPKPTGKVTWSADGAGKFSKLTCSLESTGVDTATCSVEYIPTSASLSPVAITAQYSDFSSPPFSLAVTSAISTTSVSCLQASIVVGSSKVIKCTARVTGYSPTGMVTWSESSTNGGQVTFTTDTTCTLASGKCSINMIGTAAGAVTISGTYSGDSNNIESSGTRTLTITKAKTTLSLACSSTSAKDVWTCTATLKGYYSSVAGETIDWTQTAGSGSITFSSLTCALGSGSSGMSCSVTVTGTTKGTATIEALYAGDSDNLHSSKTAALIVK
jgi:hypothetical protein